eukprot:3193-Heterococcus_DN1.PRE.2
MPVATAIQPRVPVGQAYMLCFAVYGQMQIPTAAAGMQKPLDIVFIQYPGVILLQWRCSM